MKSVDLNKSRMQTSLLRLLERALIVPVITPSTVSTTINLVKALQAGGITAVEITLRTSIAIEAIKAVKDSGIDVKLGVGTVTSADQYLQAVELGVDFAVSPGISTALLEMCREQLPLMPGVSSASDIMLGMEYGLKLYKLFPAITINGEQLLKDFYAPFPEVVFCPTGGIDLTNAATLIQQPNVLCLGGSWLLDSHAIETANWTQITQLSRQALDILST